MPPLENTLKRLIAHELPAAPKFIGREAELDSLREFWNGTDTIVSLIGLGGAGKTALANRFLDWVDREDPPGCLLVWSFYDDPDANAFLETLYRFLTGDEQAEVKGSGWFHLLREQLAGQRRVLLILDGLERVQRPSTDASGIYGELEDPLLRGLLVRLATARGNTKAVITSRFPVSTIEPYLGRGYQVLDVEQLPVEAARELLSSRGIQLDRQQLAEFIVKFGSHALSLDLLAGAISEFFGGSLGGLPSEDLGTEPAQRLAYVLRLYESHLPELERDLLSRLCVFRFGVDSTTLARIFLQSENPSIAGSLSGMSAEAVDVAIGRLVDRHLVYRESKQRYTVHPAVRDHFYRLFRDPSAVHNAIAKHFSTLTDRPGIGLPVDKESLDLLEELIHHALSAKSFDEAAEIYFSRLGGNDHLNGTLGEYARTFRILAGFPTCPDPSAMYHCERAFGNLEKALEWRPQNRYIQLLSGKLAELGNDASESTRMMALALQGREVSVPERSPDFPICSAMVHFWRGEPEAAKRIAEMEMSISSYQDDQVRNQLALAEVYRGWGRHQQSKELIDAASEWVLQSASQERLSTLHLARAHVALDERSLDVASLAIAEGLLISEEARFLLHEILFRLASSMEKELAGDQESAIRLATHARDLADEIRFTFGLQGARKALDRLERKN